MKDATFHSFKGINTNFESTACGHNLLQTQKATFSTMTTAWRPSSFHLEDLKQQLNKYLQKVQKHTLRTIAFCGHKVAHLSTRPKLNYLPRPGSKIAFPLLAQWEESINIFHMMKRIIKMNVNTIIKAPVCANPSK